MIKFHVDISTMCTNCNKKNRDFPELQAESTAYYDVEESIDLFVENEPCRYCGERMLELITSGDAELLS